MNFLSFGHRVDNIKLLIIFTILINIQPRQVNGLIEEAIDIIKLGKDVTISILESWEIIGPHLDNGNNVDIPFYKKREKKILSKLKELSYKIDMVEDKSINRASWSVEQIQENINLNTQLHLGLHELSDLMNRITTQYNFMRNLADDLDDLEHDTLESFALSTVSSGYMSIQGLLSRIILVVTGSSDLIPVGKNGVLDLIARHLEESKSQVCSTRQSAQQVLYQLFTAISLTELKGYSMMQFSWMLLKTYGKGNYTRESELMRHQFTEHIDSSIDLLRGAMERADRIVWRCDPQQHVASVTYEEITRLLQGYIENEVDMNADNTCRENCAAYPYAENHGCFEELYCAKQPRCSGKLINCQYYDSDMWICPSKFSSNRRYEYIEYENGRILGNKGSCTRGTTKVDSWWRWLFWHCSYCLCMCDEQGPKSDRYFSLREVVSNIEENRVITGLRFKKSDRIIHLQIQEGELLISGRVDNHTKWQPISTFQTIDSGIRNGVDYHTLTWDKRSIDLDDLIAPNKHVITGVRFRMVGSHLNLEARVTEIDSTGGKLIDVNKSYWISNDYTESSSAERRTQIQLKRPDISIKTRSKSLPTSTTNQYVEFTHTDIDADVAQTTVPFIDCQDVSSLLPVALSGIGIYHKGQENFGGFIAPKLITIDLVNYLIKPEPPSEHYSFL